MHGRRIDVHFWNRTGGSTKMTGAVIGTDVREGRREGGVTRKSDVGL